MQGIFLSPATLAVTQSLTKVKLCQYSGIQKSSFDAA